jgi:hypothetical protein
LSLIGVSTRRPISFEIMTLDAGNPWLDACCNALMLTYF